MKPELSPTEANTEVPTLQTALLEAAPTHESRLQKFVPGKLTTLITIGTLAFSAASYEQSHDNTAHAQDISADIQPGTPAALAQRADNLITSTAKAWSDHLSPEGNIIDPVLGAKVRTYGEPMLAQAMIDAGVANNDQVLIQTGIKALFAHMKQPDNNGFNVGFEVFGMADGYARNEEFLAENPDWQAAREQIGAFIRQRAKFTVGESKNNDVQKCFDNPGCWTNLKLVRAFASIQLRAAGLENTLGAANATNKTNPALPHDVRKSLAQATRHANHNATRQGSQLSYGEAGILSDPTKNPLAYNALCAMLLGQVIEDLGPARAPSEVKRAFERSAKSLVGLMAPDGDVAYIGRGQGQVWNVAAAADALAIAAHLSNNPVWRGRYLQAAERAIQRLEKVYTLGDWGMPLVPRFVGDSTLNHNGIDRYASSTGYNGLALFALRDAVDVLIATPSASKQNIGADVDGTFVDPSNTKFATMKKGNLWWAIHGSDTHTDARYDFGLVAAQRKQADGSWEPALPYRPYTHVKASGGPMIVDGRKKLVPLGTSISAQSNGVVTVKGGWGAKPNDKPSIDTGTKWVFKPENNGVNMSFEARANRKYQFQVWFAKGSTLKKTKGGLEVIEPNGRHEVYKFNRPVHIKAGPNAHSAYDENLGSTILTVKPKKNGKIVYTTKF